MKPATRVVKIQHTGMLMTSGNGVTSNRTNYGTANDGVDSNELDGDGNWSWD